MLQNLFRNLPGVTKNLLLINVVMFVLSWAFPNVNGMLSLHYFESPLFEPYQIVTHFFMHGDFRHLLFNMITLIVFGPSLERIWGEKRFLFFYLFSAVGAFLLHIGIVWYELSDVPADVIEFLKTEGAEVISGGQNYVDPYIGGLNAKYNGSMVGASGAIMGLIVAFGYIFPNTELQLLFPPMPVKAKYLALFLIGLDLFLGFGSFNDGIAHFAHLGGALFGIILVLIWRKDRTKFY